ncbi:aminotransferase [Streptomyces albiaxialis]|uniref:Aminotransferase n=1 Tax=Streptomyces albiaxialis TaxID=329523 RepID=A0ABN2W5N8_9ACTN
MSIAEYTIQSWLFDEAEGRYDIDLAESGVRFQLLSDLRLDPEWDLDYSLDRGRAALREAIAGIYGAEPPAADSVAVTHGAQEALYLLYRSLLSPGDHVVATSPGWQQAWEVPRAAGCEVTVLPWRPGTPFDTAALAAAVGPRTRAIVINSPGNPSGCVLGEEEWAAVTEIAAGCGAWLVNDEEYLLDFRDSVVHRTPLGISVSSLSKVYGMPALRLGWIHAPGAVVEGAVNYKRYTTVSNSAVWERAAEQVLAERDRHVERYRRLVAPGAELLDTFVARHPDRLRLVRPQGTPFAWLETAVRTPSRELAERLVAEHRTLVMPAEVFGAEHAVRLSFARPADVLEEGLTRFDKLLAETD